VSGAAISRKSGRGGFREARWLTRERLLRYGSALAFVTVGVLALDAAARTIPGLTNAAGEHLDRDFVQFWTSARLAAAGKPVAAYVFGAPDHIAERLEQLRVAGVGYVLINGGGSGGGARGCNSLRRFAREVMPHFIGASQRAAE
jgi:hypothetical protein